MTVSIATLSVVGRETSTELEAVCNALLVDVTAIRTKFLALTAKLDLDAGITATNFASTCDPAALTTVV